MISFLKMKRIKVFILKGSNFEPNENSMLKCEKCYHGIVWNIGNGMALWSYHEISDDKTNNNITIIFSISTNYKTITNPTSTTTTINPIPTSTPIWIYNSEYTKKIFYVLLNTKMKFRILTCEKGQKSFIVIRHITKKKKKKKKNFFFFFLSLN